MGTSDFAAKILKALFEANLNISSVFTRPDKKSGRNHQLKESEVKKLALQKNLSVFQPENLNEDTITEIENQSPDLIIVAAYGRIIPEKIINIPRLGIINIHPSLLPKFRGPSPIQNALLNGETETGTTLMLIDEGMDTGDILKQVSVKIDSNEKYPELLEKLARLSADLLLEVLPLWIEGKVKTEKQDDSKATLCQLIEKNDGRILWTDSAESIFNRYRALFPWPGIFAFWKNGEANKRLKFNKISLLKNKLDKKYSLGEIFKFEEKICVQTSLGVIVLEEIQLEGKENMPINNFANGYQDFIGSILK